MTTNNILASVLAAWLLWVPSSQALPWDLQETSGIGHVSRSLTGRGRGRRGGSCSTRGDDALDPKTPRKRAQEARKIRREEADREEDGSRDVCQIANGDREADGSPLLIAKFHKTLPHDDLGQVDPDAYAALEDCAFSGDFDTCEAIPAGGSNAFLINPLGGKPVDMSGPASSAVTMPPMHDFDSPELAGQMAECYWMALTRDVPFSQYGTNELTVAAAGNLAAMPGFPIEELDVPTNPDGSIDPEMHLFRSSFVGVDKGPMISQLLVSSFTIDSIKVEPRMSSFIPGVDYLTDYDSWLLVQNGAAPAVVEERDPVIRYIRNGRDLSTLVFTDIIYTEAFRGALVLLQKGGINDLGFNGPYTGRERQKGFVTFGRSNVMRILGAGEGAQRASWYQKWNVHLMTRPEAIGGVIHNTLTGALTSNIHESLLENSDLLDRVYAANDAQNGGDGSSGTYLLSQAVAEGSPSHPSYPSGHAVQNGAFATVLKAMSGLELGRRCFPDPVVPDADGLELLPYEPRPDETCIGEDGKETTGLSFEGEINKLASNVALGRSVMGVHYRYDGTEGMILGETFAVRLLHQEVIQVAEEVDLEFNLLRGNTIKLFQDGTFSIDGELCVGDVYLGVEHC